MIKKNVYFTISVTFILVLVMFLMFSPDFYSTPAQNSVDMSVTHKSNEENNSENINVYSTQKILVAADDGDAKNNILHWLSLMHQPWEDVELSALPDNKGEYSTLIMHYNRINDEDVLQIKAFLESGGNVIFASMPTFISDDLASLMGVVKYESRHKIKGLDIYEGVLLGGTIYSDDYEMDCLKITLSGRSKAFANGYFEKEDRFAPDRTDHSSKNPLIWRTYHNGSCVVAVNAPFFQDQSGIGILAGVLALSQDNFIYPVVGTKTVTLKGFPYTENSALTINGRSPFIFSRDIMWPDLMAIANSAGITYTCYANGNFENDPDASRFLNYLESELYKLNKGEVGYIAKSGIEEWRYNNDMQFFENDLSNGPCMSFIAENPEYVAQAAKSGTATSVLVNSWEGAFTWFDEKGVQLPVISSGANNEYMDYIFASYVSAMGISLHEMDMEPIYAEEYPWNRYSREMSVQMTSMFDKYPFLEAASARKTAETVKNYLNVNYEFEESQTGIDVKIANNSTEALFILRTIYELDESNSRDCSVEKIENGAYLIKASGPDFSVYFKE